MASISNPSLYSSPPHLSLKTERHRQVQFQIQRLPSSFSRTSPSFACRPAAGSAVRVSSVAQSQPSPPPEEEEEKRELNEEYEVELDKPYGLKFFKGRDGGTYIDAIAPGGPADKTGLFSVGDRVISTRFHFFPINFKYFFYL